MPAAIEEFHPPHAEAFRDMQSRLLQIFFGYGYQFILPPTVEYAHSLVLNSKADPEHEPVVFYGADPPLGLRADFTPQAARMDAGMTDQSKDKEMLPNRLCYCGEVFRRHGESEYNPRHLGAELFGEEGTSADHEVISLLASCIADVHRDEYVLSLGHASWCGKLVKAAGLRAEDSEHYYQLLACKSVDRITSFVASLDLADAVRDILTQLPHLCGDDRILAKAVLLTEPLKNSEVSQTLAELQKLCRLIKKNGDAKMRLFLDLAEVPGRGYSYHNGPVFGVYLPDHSACLAKGGRYDAIGAHYSSGDSGGSGRPATGFGINLGALFRYLMNRNAICSETPASIFAPYAPNDASLITTLRDLRADNQRIVRALRPGQTAGSLGCAAELVKENNRWRVKKLPPKQKAVNDRKK